MAPGVVEAADFPVPDGTRSEAEVLRRFMSMFCTELL